MTPPPEGWRAQLPGSPAAQRRLGAPAATASEAHEAFGNQADEAAR